MIEHRMGSLVRNGRRGVTPLAIALGAAVVATAAAPEPAATPLREATRGRFLVGAAVSPRQIDDSRVANLIAREFDCLTAENEFKPQSVQPRPGQFQFERADRLVAFAERHGMKVIGHTLCWHSQAPAWLFQNEQGEPLSRADALRNLKAHIDGVAGHFRGKVLGWDVVNEAIIDGPEGYLRQTPALRAIGDDYLIHAFRFAQEADPDAELYYNDYGIENPAKLDRTLRLVRELKAAGVRLDAVGIQSHLRLDDPGAVDRVDRAITALAAEGVKVVLSEIDVDVLPRRTRGADTETSERDGANPYTDGLPPEVAEAQADYYGRLLKVVLNHPGVVTRVTFWGTHDGSSWLNHWPIAGRTNHPLLWDRNLEPKPALRAIQAVLTAP